MYFNAGNPSNSDIRQWIVSAAGVVFDAKRGNSNWNSDIQVAAGRDSNSWILEIAIPLKDVSPNQTQPTTFFANFARHDIQTRQVSSWIVTNHIPNNQNMGVITKLGKNDFAEAIENEAAELKDDRNGFLIWSVTLGHAKFSSPNISC